MEETLITEITRNNISLAYALGYFVKSNKDCCTLYRNNSGHGVIRWVRCSNKMKRDELFTWLSKRHNIEIVNPKNYYDEYF